MIQSKLASVDEFTYAYYDAIGKFPPANGTNARKYDVTSIKRVRKGDCLPKGKKADFVRKFLKRNNFTQPKDDLFSLWCEICFINASKLPRYCHDFVYNPYSDSKVIEYISPWLWYCFMKQGGNQVPW